MSVAVVRKRRPSAFNRCVGSCMRTHTEIKDARQRFAYCVQLCSKRY